MMNRAMTVYDYLEANGFTKFDWGYAREFKEGKNWCLEEVTNEELEKELVEFTTYNKERETDDYVEYVPYTLFRNN